MKNSKEYSKKITSFYQSLKRKHGSRGSSHQVEPEIVEKQSIVNCLIYGIICEKLSEEESQAALKRFSGYFVDWNDLRVSRIEEIAELIGKDSPENRQIATTITKVLQRIFNENHQISLESLQKLGKRQARQKLEKMEELSRYVIDYCMLTSLSSHAIPLTEKMIDYLKINDLVDKNADAQTIEGFLSKQISAKNGYEFYKLLRHESETQNSVSSPVSQDWEPKTTSRRKKSQTAKKTVKKKKQATSRKPRAAKKSGTSSDSGKAAKKNVKKKTKKKNKK